MKKHIKKIITCIIFAMIGINLVKFVIITHTPVKYSVKLENIKDYPNSILVQQTWHTGTGWEQVGDENGFYTNFKKIVDVKLEGNLPLQIGMGTENLNVFLCIVEPTGTFRIRGTTSPIHLYEKFEVVDWYPIYPVKRETLLPSWFYPDKYLSKADFERKIL